ncbi:NAD(P)-dependent glycerol-3-phosphate dehydrogenase [bacterium]|nr:NAD(P)-dependent glycerol-3-phosphate dehydrogenase [bacterium]|tara:strand:+ start:53400 stop:54407 length:1008 start_codon:yes stop_codon:yes gene_type:complete
MKLKKVVTIFGAGSWGTAIAKNIATNGYKVRLWAKEKEVVESIISYNENRIFLPGIKLSSSIIPTNLLSDELFDSDFLIFSIPTQFIRESLLSMEKLISKDSILINTSKGIEQKTMKPIFSIFKEILPRVSRRYITISGPSFAYDVAKGLPTSVTLASANGLLLPVAMKIFENQNFKTYTSKDVLGVELGGSLKNVIAIGAGILDGINSSESTKAAFITRGLNEIRILSKTLGAKNITFMGLSGIGDLMLTAYGEQSRNRNLGLNIGRGKKIKTILQSTKTVAEGFYTSKAIYELTKKYKIQSPIIESIYKILYKSSNPKNIVKNLLKNDGIADI